MAERQKFRSARRPPPIPRPAQDENVTDEVRSRVDGEEDGEEQTARSGNPIADELKRRGIKDADTSAPTEDAADDDPGEATGEVAAEELGGGVKAVADLSEAGEDGESPELAGPAEPHGAGAESGDALVFDAGPTSDAGPTFVGALPMDTGGKTQILAAPEGVEEQFPVLAIESSAGASDVEVVRDAFVIGRAPDCDVVLPDQLVSRRHVIIEKRADGWYVVDQGSGNGTFLNAERVTEALLSDGDVLKIGDATITFTAPGGTGEAAPGQSMSKTTMLPSVPQGTSVVAAVLPAKSRRKKLLLITVTLVVLLLVLAVAKKVLSPPPPPPGPTPEQIAAQEQEVLMQEAKAKFERAKDLVKQAQWSQAKPLILEVMEVVPDDASVKEYHATILKEAGAENAMLEAKAKLATDDFEGAAAQLARIPDDSEYFQQAEQLRKQITDRQAVKRVETIRQYLDEKKYDEAIALASVALQNNPDDAVVTELKKRAEAALHKPITIKGPTPPPTTPVTPPKSSTLLSGAALAAYRDANLDGAESQASPEAAPEVKKFKSLFQHGKELSSNPGQATQAAKYLNEALILDKKLGGGQGKINEEIKTALAKVYFVKGVDAHTRKNYPEAFSNYSQALRVKPGMKTAQDRIRELEGEAKALYEAAYVFKSTQSERAIQNCKTVMGMIRPEIVYFSKCKKLLNELQGGGETVTPEDGEF